ncbi:MAG: hypothetical protein A2514_01105 [Gammaproteobacteria bacterium RIFOXYD12_FULL_61_37]|nr:MAG: hypothetical protein A2514_01105 [Gammaproteobacteria bacterium RIFOXYD12_FULL_61_37]
MKRLITLLAIAALAVPALATGPFNAALDETAEQIRSGALDVGKKYSMDFSDRFHTIHTKALGMGCVACHATQSYSPDHLYLRAAEFPQRGHPGPVPRADCIGCHQQQGSATPWYGMVRK